MRRISHRTPAAALALAVLVSACKDDTVSVQTGLPLELQWPVPGDDGADWVINNYVDVDPELGPLDYQGGTKTYDGHRGIDIDVPNFRWMDGDHPIVAAHAGEVVALEEGQPDRNVSCTGDWNFVNVRHDDGSLMIYGHVKRNSVVVAVGQRVAAGETIAVVGSSGCSTQPHLHLELRGADGTVVDPFQRELWASPPRYDTPLDFMDLVVKAGAIAGVDEMKDPAPNTDAVTIGGPIAVGVSMAGGTTGDQIEMTVTDGSGGVVVSSTTTLQRTWRHTYWFWNRTIPATAAAGNWTVSIFTNGTLRATYPVTAS